MRKILSLIIFCISLLGFSQTHGLADEYWAKAIKAEEIEDWENAAKLFEKAAIAEKKSPTPRQKDLIYELNRSANSYLNINKYQKALPLYLESLVIIEKTLGKEHKNYGYTLSELAFIYKKQKQHERAIPLYIEAIANAEKNTGKDHSVYGVRVSNLAKLYKSIKQYEEALPLYIEVLKITEKALGKEHSEYGYRLTILANLYFTMEQYQKALPLYLEAIANAEKNAGKELSVYGTRINNLANLYKNIKQYEKALPLYIEVLKITGKEHSDYGTRLNNLANLYRRMGLYEKALPLYIEALENTEKALGKEHSSYGIRLNGLAGLFESMGQYEKALPLYLEALENTEKALGKEHSSYGTSLANLANLYAVMGEYQKALVFNVEALENTEKTLGKEHLDYGYRLHNLASIYVQIGQYEKALPLITKALENTEKTLGKEHRNYGSNLNLLAYLYCDMGKHEKALPLYQEALENTKKTLGKEHSSYGISLNNLAELYMYLGQYKMALPLFLEVLEVLEKTLGKEHKNYGTGLSNLALLYKNMGQYEKSLTIFKELNINTITQIKQNFSFQNEKGKELFIKNVVGLDLNEFSQFNFISNNSYTEAVSLATNNIMTSKGLLLNSSKNIFSHLKSLNQKEINNKIDQFRLKKSNINQQLQLPISKRISNFNKEQESLELLERNITRLYSKYFNEEINYVKDWKNTQLKENDLAIEFTHFEYYNKKWTDSTMYTAYLYKKDWKTPKVVNLFEEKQLKKYFSISSNPNNLYKSRGTITKSTTAQLALADSIYKLVWKPLEKYLDTTNTIYFSPDGLLHKIPFAALPNKENKLIGEVYNIQQMGNTADIRTNNKQPNLNDILLIGGVKYDYPIDSTKQKKEFTYSVLESKELLGDTINRNISRSGFGYLEGTAKEIKDINSLLGNSKQLSGYNATETAFKKLSGNSPSILHIATHGFFFKKPKEKPKQNELLGQKNSYRQQENPLLRSGLLFANANYAWQNGNNPYEEDDGILTALEISNLDLKNTDIVILSACETGLGDIAGSEGVYGLQRAFKMAGVKTIIMSLWEVPDAETAEFMNLFYTKWKTYNNSKKAFKETQQQMMNKYRDEPQKWAAFVYFE